MLVLARDVEETLIFKARDFRVEVTVLEVDPGGHVKLGIKASQDVHVLRKELEGHASVSHADDQRGE